MSSASAPLSLEVCIRRSWESFPLPKLSCRNFNSCLLTSEALPGRPGGSRSLTNGRHLCRPSLRMSGTLVVPYNSWPSVPWRRIFNRRFSCRGWVKSLQDPSKAGLSNAKHRAKTSPPFLRTRRTSSFLVDFRLHFLQDVGVGLAVLHRHLDGVA